MIGVIVHLIAGFYYVESEGKVYQCKAKGVMKFNNDNLLAGDIVEFEHTNVNEGQIHKIHQRKNSLLRPPVANIDQALIFQSVKTPKMNIYLIDKIIAYLKYSSIKSILIFTKKDLLDSSDTDILEQIEDYKKHYEVHLISNTEDKFETSKIGFANKISLLIGQSGVGKSTFLNNVKDSKLRTVDEKSNLIRGRHTTRSVELISFENGKIVDTPGFSLLNLNLIIPKDDFAKCYYIFDQYYSKCKFQNCIHSKENNCEIKRQAEKDVHFKIKYENYLKMLTEYEQ